MLFHASRVKEVERVPFEWPEIRWYMVLEAWKWSNRSAGLALKPADSFGELTMRHAISERNAGWRRLAESQAADVLQKPFHLASWRPSPNWDVESQPGSRPNRRTRPSPTSEMVAPVINDLGREILEAARSQLEWMRCCFDSISHVIYLVDQHGLLLDVIGNDEKRINNFNLVAGSNWTALIKGIKGAGTTLTRNQPVAVLGPERPVRSSEDFSLFEAPLHATNGLAIGAIGLLTHVRDGTPERLCTVAYCAQLIDQEFRTRALEFSELDSNASLVRDDWLEWLPVSTIILDPEGRIVALNSLGEKLLGQPLSRVVGRTPWEVQPEFVGTIMEKKIREVGIRGEPAEFEFQFPSQPYWQLVRIQPGPRGLIMQSREVTQERQVFERLKASEEGLRLFADLKTDFTLAIRLGLNGDANLVAASTSFFQILGLTLEEVDSRGWQSLVHEEDLPQLQRFMQELREGRSAEIELRMISAIGPTARWLRLVCRPVWDVEKTRVVRVVGAGQDVTSRKSLELALKDAERQNIEFLATLAHELRNPLAPIRNSLHAIRADVSGSPIEPVQEMMERQVERLSWVVDSLIDASRLSRGKLEIEKAEVDFSSLIRRAVEAARPRLEQGQHPLSLQLPSHPLRIFGDRFRLEQVLDSLIDNAIRYNKPGGAIRIEVEQEGEEARIKVSDEGIGMSAELLPRIFDLFTQGKRVLIRSQGGLGVGLTLVRRIVELHGGTVRASSPGVGMGSEFVFSLACLPEMNDEPSEPITEPSHAADLAVVPREQGRRALVVDDNVDSARSMASLLSRLWGYTVSVAYDATSALALAGSFEPEMVLLDIGLPDLNGYELARKLRSLPKLQDALLVAMSGWGRDEDVRKSYESGINHHLVKPVTLEELEALLDQRAPGPAPDVSTRSDNSLSA